MQSGNSQQYLWLIGNAPFFDNARASQSDQLGELLLSNNNTDLLASLDAARLSVEDGCSEQLMLGNQLDALFLETCIRRIRD